MFIYLSLSTYLCIDLPICLNIYLSIQLSINLSLYICTATDIDPHTHTQIFFISALYDMHISRRPKAHANGKLLTV